jgi:hypothetical protein
MARLLRAAPQLRRLTFEMYFARYEDVHWILSGAFRPAGSFMVMPFHLQLRHLAVSSETLPVDDVPVPRGCGVRLRQRHFPRLRRLTVGDTEYPVWVPQSNTL